MCSHCMTKASLLFSLFGMVTEQDLQNSLKEQIDKHIATYLYTADIQQPGHNLLWQASDYLNDGRLYRQSNINVIYIPFDFK